MAFWRGEADAYDYSSRSSSSAGQADFWAARRATPHDVPVSSGRGTPMLHAAWPVEPGRGALDHEHEHEHEHDVYDVYDRVYDCSPASPSPPPPTWTGGSHFRASFADPPPPSRQWCSNAAQAQAHVQAQAQAQHAHIRMQTRTASPADRPTWRPVQSYVDWQREREDLMFAAAGRDRDDGRDGWKWMPQPPQPQPCQPQPPLHPQHQQLQKLQQLRQQLQRQQLQLQHQQLRQQLQPLAQAQAQAQMQAQAPTQPPPPPPPADTDLWTDDEAAASVSRCLATSQRRNPGSRHARILLGLIHPKSAQAEFRLDNCALESIFLAANEIFFSGRLTHRVRWGWSAETASAPPTPPATCPPTPASGIASGADYDGKIIGHTALRPARAGGFETYILLSTPILRSPQYNRRLLISAFLHELIHCYLFICCGWRAREAGGHTPGFRAIADTIDRWAGRQHLHLDRVEADLDRFLQAPAPHDPRDYLRRPCSSNLF